MASDSKILKKEIRLLFTSAMSEMYQNEVPLYKKLFSLVRSVNKTALERQPDLLLSEADELLDIERHGAIRLGTAHELSTMRRLFAVMGMQPVDYYDLSVAGIPVHSTAFRETNPASLKTSPFRIFTSLLRLDLIEDTDLRDQATQILARRNIFSEGLLELIETAEKQSGLTKNEAQLFVEQALETFRWHQTALVDKKTYDSLSQAHRLIADVVSFKGPHINHLTPRTLDIDAVQEQMIKQGFQAKQRIEGPPRRKCPILLRQTSFIALEESVQFSEGKAGTHTARFGEIEQRGGALTPKGRKLYDDLLLQARGESNQDYDQALKTAFAEFPDTDFELFEQGLAYYQFTVAKPSLDKTSSPTLQWLIENEYLKISPIIYEDFLPVSAAGIFQSNLDDKSKQKIQENPNQVRFEKDLGCAVTDSFSLYEKIQQDSLNAALNKLNV